MSTSALPEGYDAITLEVIRMRLDSIVEEMGNAMIRSSGSPVITESGDFNTALFDPTGKIFGYSDYVQFHIGSGGVAVRNLVEVIKGEPLFPGDAFICNDPHTAGASHPPDTNVISPIFVGDDLVGWAQSQAHLLDVGGMTPGGFAPGAYDCYSEAVRLPPGIKVFEKGKPVEAIRRLLLNNVRVPGPFWNDVRSLVASNNTGIRRVQDTVEEFGLEAFREYVRLGFELGEQVVRDRLRLIPDGVFQADEWTEHNGHVNGLYRVHCTMTKTDDQITFDFSETSPQTNGFVNCSLGATIGSVASAVVPIVAWDVPFNEGVMTAFNVVTTSGSLVDPVPPAPISNGHLTTGARVSRVVTKCMNQAIESAADEVIRNRTQGIWADSWTGGISAGTVSASGEYFVFFNMDGGGMGQGAQPYSDGLDCSGMMTQINNTLPDVEMNEMLYPVLYLWKRLNAASMGHGMHRGGVGHEFAWTLHGSESVVQTVFAPTGQVPPDGYGGGLPGGGSGHAIWRDTNVGDLIDTDRLPTEDSLRTDHRQQLEVNEQDLTVGPRDVFVQWVAGGGGYGDPLLRDPASVARDVQDRYVSSQVATDVYGVVLTADLAVDTDSTTSRRNELRRERLGSAPPREVPADVARSGADACTPQRGVNGWACPACASSLGDAPQWTDGAHLTTSPANDRLAAFGVRARPHPNPELIVLEETICPNCATLLDARLRVDTTEAVVNP
jgi:N-methylhydantoinase B